MTADGGGSIPGGWGGQWWVEGKQGGVGIARAPLGGGGVHRDQVSNLLTFPFAFFFTLYRTAYIQTKDGIGVYIICMCTLNRGYFGPGGVTLTQSKNNYVL